MQTLPIVPLRPGDVTLRQADSLVGLPYRRRAFNCLHLAVHAQWVLFGRVVAGTVRAVPTRAAEQDRMLLELRDELADRVDEPVVGDVALFEDLYEPGQWHIGTLFSDGCEPWMLHSREAVGRSVLERLRETMTGRGLRLEGCYRWRAQA